ncbi:MAG: TIGR02444 family protein [Oceanospirillales bacterium LUC14_002_19_P2]|nr:MAG: TIGR02444 family protein [Oceanospirillales bacterium LUC14_002_19_P2]
MKNISDHPFWHYSVQLWPTAGETLLMLQDSYQLDINMVLFCCWLANEKRILHSSDQLAHYWPEISRWQRDVIHPLRIVRQNMKVMIKPDVDLQALYSKCKQVELYAECIQQKRLFDLKNQLSRSSGIHSHKRLEENLQQYLNLYGANKNDYQMLQTLLVG